MAKRVTRVGPWKRPRTCGVVVLGGGLLLSGCVFVNDAILPIKQIDDMSLHSEDARERYFHKNFPTSDEIDKYLTDATIVVSAPTMGNEVYYFERPNRFLQWGWSTDKVHIGTWWTKGYLLPMTLHGSWRVALVYAYCHKYSQSPADLDVDNCILLDDLGEIMAEGVAQYRRGNIFRLQLGSKAPFVLPQFKPIAIDELLRFMSEADQK